MKAYDDARTAFLECKKMVGKSDIPTTEMRDKYRIKLAKQMSVFNVKKGVTNDMKYLAGSPLTQLTSNEKCLFDNDVQLKQDAMCEDVIFCERPLAIVLQVGTLNIPLKLFYSLVRNLIDNTNIK